jgi:hypothetical protein
MSPFTSSFVPGVVVLIPTFPAPVKYIVDHPLFDVQYCIAGTAAQIGVPYVSHAVVVYHTIDRPVGQSHKPFPWLNSTIFLKYMENNHPVYPPAGGVFGTA